MRGPSNKTVAILAVTVSTGSLSVGYWLVRRYLLCVFVLFTAVENRISPAAFVCLVHSST